MAVLLRTGPGYPNATSTSAPGEIAEAAMRTAAGRTSAQLQETGSWLRIAFGPSRGDVATIWTSLAEAVVDLTDEQVEAYFAEIDAPDHVRRAWAGAGAGRRWREAFAKFAKTIVVGDANGADQSWRAPVGQRLEIVPESDPRALRVGGALRMRVLLEGRPLPQLAVFCVDPKGRIAARGHTDAAGRIACPLSERGAWLVRGTELRRAQAGGAAWESLWATLTVQVR